MSDESKGVLTAENPGGESDPGKQLAPIDGQVDVTVLKTAFETTVRDCSSYNAQCRQNYETRFAIWNGQSADNKKHSREGSDPEPTPWDGASDMRVYEVDAAINYKVALYSMARRKANLIAIPVNSGQIERAKVVSNFMRWLINTQVPQVDREDELLAQYLKEKGIAIMGQFWEKRVEKVLDVITMKDIQAMLHAESRRAGRNPQQEPSAQEILSHPDTQESFENALMQFYEVPLKKARRMMRELTETGETSIAITGREISRPILRAFNLDEDIFIPPYATDIETTPYIFRVQYYTAEQLRGFVVTDGWDEEWVEDAIQTCKGKMITLVPDQSTQPISRNFIFRYQRFNDLIGVVYGYRRLSDEDNIPGIYLTIFNPDLPAGLTHPGYAKHNLLPYRHGRYPFVLHRAEYLSRRIHDSRGIPEVGKTFQDNIKACRDSRMDAASIGIMPPLGYPLGRPPGTWGPGAKIGERRQGEYHFMDRPSLGGDANTEKTELIQIESLREYNGIHTGDEDNQVATVLNQFETDKYLSGWSASLWQIWKLWQQYGEDGVFFQVIGLKQADPAVMRKGDPMENYDFYMTYDAINFDPEARAEKWERIISICQQADRDGVVNWSALLHMELESEDPVIAETIIMPKEQATQQIIQKVKGDLQQIYSGIPTDFTPGTPPQLALQVIQTWMQQPDVAQRMQNDAPFQKRVETYAKEIQFQMMQQQNAVTGKLGQAPSPMGG